MLKKISILHNIVIVRAFFFASNFKQRSLKEKYINFEMWQTSLQIITVFVDNSSCECNSAHINDEVFNVDLFRSEFIFDKFGFISRRKTSIDTLLRIVEVADYINAILMLDLTMMLIMKDMRVNKKIARNIFYQNTKLGELLNEKTTMT